MVSLASSSGSLMRPRLSCPSLVVLDQGVIGVAGEGQWIEPECVDRWFPQQPQVRAQGLQLGQVVGDQVVPQDEFGAVGEVVQPGQGRSQGGTRRGEDQGLPGIRTDPGECADSAVTTSDLEVQRETTERAGGCYPRRGEQGSPMPSQQKQRWLTS